MLTLHEPEMEILIGSCDGLGIKQPLLVLHGSRLWL